jgi:hypothetical protein
VSMDELEKVQEIVAEGVAAEGLADLVPTAEDAAARRLAGTVSDEAVDRMIADAQEAGVSLLDGPDGLIGQLRRPGDLDRPGPDRPGPGRPARHRGRGRVGPDAPQAVQGLRLGTPPRQGPRHRGHADPAAPRRQADPMWLWASAAGASPAEVTTLWQAYLRRFDLEHTFRFLKQTLGWNTPKLGDPAAADRWTWLIIAACTQLRLAAPLAAARRLPWQRPQPPGTMTPARVRQGFRAVRDTAGTPAAPPKPGTPGPDAPKDQKTSTKPPATTSANTTPKAGTDQNAEPAQAKQVKRQVPVAQSLRETRIHHENWSDPACMA